MNKRLLQSSRFILLCLVTTLCISACKQEQSNQNVESSSEENEGTKKDNSTESENHDEDDINLSLEERAVEICKLLKEVDSGGISIQKFENLIDEENKILFSPYLYIDKSNSQTLTLSEWKKFYNTEDKLNWGEWDGVGGVLELTAKEYYSRFIMRGNYCQEGEVNVDTLIEKGNALNNISEVFPASRYVSFFIPPDDEDIAQMSWKTLILVFDEENELVAIVNHEWTT